MSPDDGKHEVFISYSTKDSEVANKICHALEQNNIKCWIAPRNISSGENYLDKIAEAIKMTKLVVLVYSMSAQESKYVNNEINMAYSYNKSIISFNVDNSMPKEELEYYLKVTQWLPACPDTDEVYETLVKDAREICNQDSNVPVFIDFTNFKQQDLTKHKKDWISLILLFTLYWASFFYMGITASKKLWVLMGFLYLIPTIMCLAYFFQILGFLFIFYPIFIMFCAIYIIFWILAIIHGFVIRNEFLTRKSVLRFISSDEELFKYLYEEYLQV